MRPIDRCEQRRRSSARSVSEKRLDARELSRLCDAARAQVSPPAFKDLGAGGIMGCSAEITSSGGYGADIDLDAGQRRARGHAARSHRRRRNAGAVDLGVAARITPEVLRIYNDEFTLPQIAHNARAAIIGRVTGQKRYVLRHRGQIVMDVDIDFLTGSIHGRSAVRRPRARPRDGSPGDRNCPAVRSPRFCRACLRIATSVRACRSIGITMRSFAARRSLRARRRDAGVLAPIPGSRLGVARRGRRQSALRAVDARRAGELAVLEAVRASRPSGRGRSG